MTSKKLSKGRPNKCKLGALTDEEKRTIEQMVSTATYSQIAAQLNRKDATVRKYCQRQGFTKDKQSVKKKIQFKAKDRKSVV